MPRKRDIPKKKITPDPIYKSTYVTRLTNMIMKDGKKRTAEIDFTGTAQKDPYNYNAPLAVCHAVVLYVFRILVHHS